jgi:glucosamine--fructose-6-phosphate aminotransferase (isomerizing)
MSAPSQTRREILNQPDAWSETIRQVPDIWRKIGERLGDGPIAHALFLGSGTSLYIAQTAAQTFMAATGITASAIPASEAFLSAASTVPRAGRVLAFVISRSGTTSEALIAASHLREHHPHVTTIGVTCNAGTALESRCEHCIVLPFAAERSVVMTQSFTTMLLALQIVAARVGHDDTLLDGMRGLPAMFSEQLSETEALAKRLGEDRAHDTVIFLGLGPNHGLAEEATLKLKEMTQATCEAYNPLEFRHGPISIVDERTLVILFEGMRERAYLPDVRRDLKRHGARVVAIGPHGDAEVDERLVIGGALPDLARCVLYLPFAQLLACHRALALGLDPDRPRNLTQVVVLDVR